MTPNLLLYVAHRHGYRSGGVQNRATTEAAAVPFDAEIVNDVELGAKLNANVGAARVTIAADVYRGYYDGLQRNVGFVSLVGGSPLFVTGVVNAANAVIQGVEAESSLAIGGLSLSGNVGYTDAQYKTYKQSLSTGAEQDLSSLPFGLVPKWTVQANAEYGVFLSHAEERVSAGIGFQYVSRVYINEGLNTIGKYLPGYNTVDLRLRWDKFFGTGVDLLGVITNLTKEKYSPFGNNLSATYGYVTRFPAPPRRFEVTATYRF